MQRAPQDLHRLIPISYSLSFHSVAHSFCNRPSCYKMCPLESAAYALFCIHQNHNPFLFTRFRTLCQKHPGGG